MKTLILGSLCACFSLLALMRADEILPTGTGTELLNKQDVDSIASNGSKNLPKFHPSSCSVETTWDSPISGISYVSEAGVSDRELQRYKDELAQLGSWLSDKYDVGLAAKAKLQAKSLVSGYNKTYSAYCSENGMSYVNSSQKLKSSCVPKKCFDEYTRRRGAIVEAVNFRLSPDEKTLISDAQFVPIPGVKDGWEGCLNALEEYKNLKNCELGGDGEKERQWRLRCRNPKKAMLSDEQFIHNVCEMEYNRY